ncbi:MAG: NlpC/P60 family N-terminal domain-containing protein [Thermodesulfobacteriota bacterium]
MRKKKYCLLLMPFLLLALGGGNARGAVIRDLGELSQKPLSYVDRSTADLPLLPAGEQARLNAEYDALHFAPWHQEAPSHRPDQVTWGFRKYAGNPGYGRGGRRHPPDWIRKMAANAHLDDYPQGGFPAITVTRTDFRLLPTREPHSRYPKNQGKGYSFDNLQESSVPEGAPVFVTHVSRDRKWLLVETSYVLGWVPPEAVAAVSPEFVKNWENGRYAAIVRDKAPIRDEKGSLLFRAPLGSLFPKVGEDAKRAWIWTAVRDSKGMAILRKASAPKAAAEEKPLSMTPRRAAQLAGELAGEPYGWGGMDGKRDCSSTIRDLFAPFGLWLPRNSAEQALFGKFTSFRDLSPAEKETLIIGRGVPWRTLLWTPGHITLYIGVHQGKPLIFHNFWSIKTRDAQGKRGRIIVGRAAITTLHPGRELSIPDTTRDDLLSSLEGMVLLGEPPENGESNPPRR